MTDPRPLARLVEALSHSRSLLPDREDRTAAARLADALRERWGGPDPVRVVLVTGPDADPVGQWLETLSRSVADARENLAGVEGQLEALMAEARRRRQRVVGERDACHAAAVTAVRAWRAAPDVSASGDVYMAMYALGALVLPATPAGAPDGG